MGYYVGYGRPRSARTPHQHPLLAGHHGGRHTRTSRTSATPITNSRSPSRASTTRSRTRRSRASSSRESTSPPKFMRELIDAMQDNYSKWETREGIKNLPEFGGSSDLVSTTTRRPTTTAGSRAGPAPPGISERDPDPLGRRRMGRQQRGLTHLGGSRSAMFSIAIRRSNETNASGASVSSSEYASARRSIARDRRLPIIPTGAATQRRRPARAPGARGRFRAPVSPARAAGPPSAPAVQPRSPAYARSGERRDGGRARARGRPPRGPLAAVALEQRVEQHHPLGRPESADVGVRGARPAARVDRVHLAHLDPGRAARARARRSAARPRATP